MCRANVVKYVEGNITMNRLIVAGLAGLLALPGCGGGGPEPTVTLDFALDYSSPAGERQSYTPYETPSR